MSDSKKREFDGVDFIIQQAIHHRLSLRELRHSGLTTLDLPYATSDGYLGVVLDDNQSGASYGPTAFDESELEDLMRGAKMAVVSAAIDDINCVFIATHVCRPASRLVVIYTEPSHHMAWARAVMLTTGSPPVTHIADDETDLSTLSQLSAVMDTRDRKPEARNGR